MRTAKVQASLRIRAVSPEPSLLAHTSSESRGTFRQKARSLAPLNGWACAVKICHDGMLEDTNSLDGAHLGKTLFPLLAWKSFQMSWNTRKPTKWPACPAKTDQLGHLPCLIRAFALRLKRVWVFGFSCWSESPLGAHVGYAVLWQIIFEPKHEKTHKITCMSSKDADPPGHSPSLISLHRPHEDALGPWLPQNAQWKYW